MFLGQMGTNNFLFPARNNLVLPQSHSHLLGYILPKRQIFSSSFGCPLLNNWVWSRLCPSLLACTFSAVPSPKFGEKSYDYSIPSLLFSSAIKFSQLLKCHLVMQSRVYLSCGPSQPPPPPSLLSSLWPHLSLLEVLCCIFSPQCLEQMAFCPS